GELDADAAVAHLGVAVAAQANEVAAEGGRAAQDVDAVGDVAGDHVAGPNRVGADRDGGPAVVDRHAGLVPDGHLPGLVGAAEVALDGVPGPGRVYPDAGAVSGNDVGAEGRTVADSRIGGADIEHDADRAVAHGGGAGDVGADVVTGHQDVRRTRENAHAGVV